MAVKQNSRSNRAPDDVWSSKDNLYPSLGGVRVHCDVCGSRVSTPYCERHGRPEGDYVALRDKYLSMRLIRRIVE
jgi:hypothetical protein